MGNAGVQVSLRSSTGVYAKRSLCIPGFTCFHMVKDRHGIDNIGQRDTRLTGLNTTFVVFSVLKMCYCALFFFAHGTPDGLRIEGHKSIATRGRVSLRSKAGARTYSDNSSGLTNF